MSTLLFLFFCVISQLLSILFFVQALYLYQDGKRAQRVLSSIQIFTVGIFLAVVSVFIPIYYTGYRFGDSVTVVRPLLIAIHNTFRVFILDGEFDVIVNGVKDEPLALRQIFTFHAAVLYVVAPVLTFGNVLSLFKNIRGELRYKWNGEKKIYVMSELNAKSVALARSIVAMHKDAVIVFTDVFEQDREEDYELLTQARDMNAICLKKDVSYLDFYSKKGSVEIFLIGNDESENVSQAVKITTELNARNTKQNVKVFVFSSKPGSSAIVDSIRYDRLLQHASNGNYGEDTFKLRRIDEKQQLIRNTVPKMNLFDLADRHGKTLSVLIAGFGNYGTEFFKMLVWYCQFEGYRLEINIFDQQKHRTRETDHIKGKIKRDSPELWDQNGSEVLGDAHYDIQTFPDVDVLSSELDELILYQGDDPERLAKAQRLRATNLVFVALGDDDINIDVAIHFRVLFDQVNRFCANSRKIRWQDEPVDIYSVVFDDQKCGIMDHELPDERDVRLLLNHKDVPYHIHFIGSLSSQFHYRNIYDAGLEQSAYEQHRGWVAIEEAIYKEWEAAGDKNNIENHDWYFSEEKTEEAAEKARRAYEQYEYYRLSSIAKELYQREIKNSKTLSAAVVCLKPQKKQTCQCENCVRRKRSEHMRWNAYTRVIGYSCAPKRMDRAFLHDNLRPWGELNPLEQLKD